MTQANCIYDDASIDDPEHTFFIVKDGDYKGEILRQKSVPILWRTSAISFLSARGIFQ